MEDMYISKVGCKEHPDIEVGKTYKFAGYDWTVCVTDNECHSAVLQSHGVTVGLWPGYLMPQFGNGSFYKESIDGQDIHEYDAKMLALYNVVKEVEGTSTSYGSGLYLMSSEKSSYIDRQNFDCEILWRALMAAASNTYSFGLPAYDGIWTGTVVNDKICARYVNSWGNVYAFFQDVKSIVAPAFNLDLSKVEIEGDEIIIKAI